MANRWLDQYNTTLIKGQVTLFCTFNVGAAGAPTLLTWNPPSAVLQTAGNYTNATTGPTTMPGAPNKYQNGSSGIYSITRNSTGNYTIALQDSYTRLLGMNAMIVSSTSGGAAAPTISVVSGSTNTNVASATAPKITVQFMSTASTAADPANGDQITIEFQLQNSAAFG